MRSLFRLLAYLACVAAFAMSGCKHDAAAPPPMALGRCVVDTYQADRPDAQTCVWGGYTWACTLVSFEPEKGYTCRRMSEAAGERVVTPPDAAPAQDGGGK